VNAQVPTPRPVVEEDGGHWLPIVQVGGAVLALEGGYSSPESATTAGQAIEAFYGPSARLLMVAECIPEVAGEVLADFYARGGVA